MTLELISFDENGQGVINFESLELVTDKEFVDSIKRDIKRGYVAVNVLSNVYGVIVYLKDSLGGFVTHTYNDGFTSCNRFCLYDLKLFGLKVVPV